MHSSICAAFCRHPDPLSQAGHRSLASAFNTAARHFLLAMIVRACIRLAIQRLTFTYAMLFTDANLHLQTTLKYRGIASFQRLTACHRVVLMVPRKPRRYKNRITMENTSGQPCAKRLEAKLGGWSPCRRCMRSLQNRPEFTAAFFDYVWAARKGLDPKQNDASAASCLKLYTSKPDDKGFA